VTPEGKVKAAVLRALAGRNIMAWTNPTGCGRTMWGSFIRFGALGAPVVIAILPGGRFCGVECKSAQGRQSDDQKAWQRQCEAAGGLYVVVRSVAELTAAMERWGYW
jgi:hypothetical protein